MLLAQNGEDYTGGVKELEIRKLELELEEARQLRGLERSSLRISSSLTPPVYPKVPASCSISSSSRAISMSEYEISYIPYENSELVKMALAGEEMKARFSLETEDTALCAGQFAVIMVYQLYREDVLTIPINALYRDGSGQYVYRQVDGARVRCDVKAGPPCPPCSHRYRRWPGCRPVSPPALSSPESPGTGRCPPPTEARR